MKLLYFVPETVSTHRADVAVLFGSALPKHGILTHLVGMPAEGATSTSAFADVSMPGRTIGRAHRELAYLGLSLRTLAVSASGCDVLQVRDMVPTGLLVMVWAWLLRRPFVYWMSFLMSEGRIERARSDLARQLPLRGRLRACVVLTRGLVERWLLYRVVLRQADHVFVQSDEMRRHVARRGIAYDRLTPVPMGVDCDRLNPDAVVPRRLAGWEGVPIIAYLGMIERRRRFDLLVDAMVILRARFPAARLLLIGDAPAPAHLDELSAYVRCRGLADVVHVTGWLPTDDAWTLLAGADAAVSVIPRGEIFDVSSPTKLLEYLALATPCVANDSPDQAWVLAQSGAGLLCATTSQAIAGGLIEILEAPAVARRRALAGPAFIRRERSYSVIGARVAEQYRRIAARRFGQCRPAS